MRGPILKGGFCTILTATILTVTPAIAHDYAELNPLDPELRGFLISLLEDAGAANRFDGSPETLNLAGTKLSSRLTAVINTADTEDLNWLADADYDELKHPELGRVPTGFVLQLLSDLADDIAHAEEHSSAERSEAMRDDMARLDTLSKEVWGR